MRRAVRVALALLALAPGTRAAQDWPCWRGPDGDGVAKSADWRPAGHVLWTRDVGPGFSSASVAGDALWTLGFDDAEQRCVLWCLDAATGAVRWTARWPGKRNTANRHDGGTLSTPLVAGDAVYVTSSEGWLRAFARADGALLWARHVAREVGTAPDEYGFGASPIAHADQVIVCVDRVVGLDARTGEIRWKTRPLGVHHSTPTLFELGGVTRLAAFGKEELVVLALDGTELHRHPWHEGHVGKSIATPVAVGERVFVSSGENRGCALLAFEDGATRVVWQSRVMQSAITGCVRVGDCLYGFDESLLKCIDLEGRERWRVRGLGNGALSAAGERLLVLSSRGELVVAEARPDAYVELYRAELFDGGTFWAPPVFAHGRVYARSSLGRLVCTEHRAPPPSGAAGASATLETPAAPPDARALFARHLELVGGAERVRRLRSVRLTGVFELRSMGVLGTEVIVQRLAPDLYREEIQFPHGLPDKVVRVYDGELAWELNRIHGDRVRGARAAREARESLALHAAADWERQYRELGEVKRVEFADRTAFRVDAVLASGAARAVFFDAATGFLLGREGPDEATVVLDDWREVDGLRLPMTERRFAADTGIEEVLRFTAVELDCVEASAFARPARFAELPRED